MMFGGEKICSIEFNQHVLRIVEGKEKDKKVTVNKKAEYPMPEGVFSNGLILDLDQMADFLQRSLKAGGFSAKKTTVVLNSDDILVREISIPFVQDSEIKSVVDFKVQDILRENAESYVTDFLVLKKIMEDGAEKLRVLLVSVPSEMVVSYMVLLNKVGLTPSSFDYTPSAISKYVFSLGSLGALSDLQDKSIAIINSESGDTVLSIMRNGVLEMHRSVKFDLNEISKGIKQLFEYTDEQVLENIHAIEDISTESFDYSDESRFLNAIRTSYIQTFDELQQVVRFYNSRNQDSKIELLVMNGRIFQVKGMEKFAGEIFDTPVVLLNSTSIESNDRYGAPIGAIIRVEDDKK